MRTHELLALVVPADGAEGLGGLVADVSAPVLQVPDDELTRLEADQHLAGVDRTFTQVHHGAGVGLPG